MHIRFRRPGRDRWSVLLGLRVSLTEFTVVVQAGLALFEADVYFDTKRVTPDASRLHIFITAFTGHQVAIDI